MIENSKHVQIVKPDAQVSPWTKSCLRQIWAVVGSGKKVSCTCQYPRLAPIRNWAAVNGWQKRKWGSNSEKPLMTSSPAKLVMMNFVRPKFARILSVRWIRQGKSACHPISLYNVHHDFQLCRIYIDHIDISACTCLRCGLQHLETWWLGSCDDLRVIAYTDSLTLKAMVQYLCLNEDLVTDQHETSLNYLYEACDESSSSSSSSHKKAWRGMQYLHKMIILYPAWYA